MSRVAMYPGSFDPITLGHTDVIERCIPLFDKLYIAVGTNTSKKYLFNKEQRVAMLKELYKNEIRVDVVSFDGLTVDLCKELNCHILVRGVRSTTDMEYERAIADSNKKLYAELETILLLSSPSVSNVSSTIVRELIRNKANVKGFVPEEILGMVY
ncbi:MAG: pantetheine-phosphate adenylyltransferase [Bacteroidetes bacterium]|nr:pantetheine-phosphate adenylyltransferase [Bacteroidota bacterium]